MIAVAMALGWASYTLILWGYCLIKGYNVSVVQLTNPSHPYSGQWPPQVAGNTAIIPDGTAASLVTASFETDTTSSSSSDTSSPTAAGGSIASIATGYKGHCYSYGGAPGTNGKHCWDCSSFVNWVVGHDAGQSIPGFAPGKYTGAVHGPPTGSWLGFGKSVSRSSMQAGDIIVWATHMGIYLGGGQMISALNEKLGTQVTSIAGGSPGGEVYVVRRVSK